MKIILCTTPFEETNACWPPIGLLYLASYLKSKSNHELKIIDGFAFNIPSEQFLNQLQNEKPDVIGLSCTSYTFLASIKLLKSIKEALPDVIIVLGGIHATFFAEKIIENYRFIDFVVKGEGEIAFAELIENLHDREKLKNIKNLAFINDGEVINNKENLITDLDSLPFPDRKLIANDDYAQYWSGFRLTPGKFTTILSSRGCPHRCVFCCCSTLFKRRWRTRSPENILNELEEIYSQGYKTCAFIDDSFTIIPERVFEICKGIKKRKIKMDFHCVGRVDKGSLKIMKEMKSAGFSNIYFGMESGSQKILDYYEKGITVEQIKEAVRNAKIAKLNVIGSFIIGAPIETRQDILETLEFASDLRIWLQIHPLGVIPGSELWSRLDAENKINDWENAYNVSEYYDNFSEKELLEYADYGYNLSIKKMLKPKTYIDFSSMLSGYNIKVALWNMYKKPISFIKPFIKIKKEGFDPFR